MKRPMLLTFIFALAAAAVLCGTGAYYARQITGLYAELSGQRRILAVRNEYIASMSANRELLANGGKSRILASDELASAIANLSLQLKAAGLDETYLKLEQREVMREADSVTGLNRLVIEGVGTYRSARAYLNELINGDIYYYVDNIKITAEANMVRLRLACVIAAGGTEELSEPPREYLFKNPFGGEEDEKTAHP